MSAQVSQATGNIIQKQNHEPIEMLATATLLSKTRISLGAGSVGPMGHKEIRMRLAGVSSKPCRVCRCFLEVGKLHQPRAYM